jgi:hypothetical protein
MADLFSPMFSLARASCSRGVGGERLTVGGDTGSWHGVGIKKLNYLRHKIDVTFFERGGGGGGVGETTKLFAAAAAAAVNL